MLRIVLGSGSFASASAELQLHATTLSKYIQRLERRFGIAILTRHGHGVSPTKAGLTLLEQVESISNRSKLAIEAIQYAQDESAVVADNTVARNALGIMIASELSDLLVGVAFASLTRTPADPVIVGVHAGRRIEDGIAEGAADLGVICDAAERTELYSEKLADEALVIAFGPSLVNAADAIVPRFHALGQIPLVLPTWEHSTRGVIERRAARAGTKLRAIAEIADFSALKNLLRQGLGYAILPHCAVADEAARGMLCVRPMEGAGRDVSLSLVCRRSTRTQARIVEAAAALVNCLSAAARADRSPWLRLNSERSGAAA
jgi:DNA-binding transcriptional LysR family regulator